MAKEATIRETWEAMEALLETGLVKNIGNTSTETQHTSTLNNQPDLSHITVPSLPVLLLLYRHIKLQHGLDTRPATLRKSHPSLQSNRTPPTPTLNKTRPILSIQQCTSSGLLTIRTTIVLTNIRE